MTVGRSIMMWRSKRPGRRRAWKKTRNRNTWVHFSHSNVADVISDLINTRNIINNLIQDVSSISWRQHDDSLLGCDSVHFDEKLIESLLGFARSTTWAYSTTSFTAYRRKFITDFGFDNVSKFCTILTLLWWFGFRLDQLFTTNQPADSNIAFASKVVKNDLKNNHLTWLETLKVYTESIKYKMKQLALKINANTTSYR